MLRREERDHASENRPGVGIVRGQTQPTVPHDLGGNALLDASSQQVPLFLLRKRKHQIRVGMQVYEAGGYDEAIGVEDALCGARLDVPDAYDLVSADAYIGPESGPPGSVYEMALFDEEIVHSGQVIVDS